MSNVPDKIILHHSLTKDGATVSWSAIRRYHKAWAYNGNIVTPEEGRQLLNRGQHVKRPWLDIGYHFGIELVGNDYEVLVGRMMTDSGAHTRGKNQDSLGICFIGNYDLAPPPKEMWDLGIKLVRSLMAVFEISWKEVYGHREFAGYKSCPGEQFDIDKFRAEVS